MLNVSVASKIINTLVLFKNYWKIVLNSILLQILFHLIYHLFTYSETDVRLNSIQYNSSIISWTIQSYCYFERSIVGKNSRGPYYPKLDMEFKNGCTIFSSKISKWIPIPTPPGDVFSEKYKGLSIVTAYKISLKYVK